MTGSNVTGKNSISFYNNGTLLDTVTGTQAAAAIIPPTSAQGSQTDYANNQFITISNILGDNAVFNSVVLSSSQNSFELDDLTWGNPFIQGGTSSTPLPATLPLFAGGFGAFGFFGWRRGRKGAARLQAAS